MSQVKGEGDGIFLLKHNQNLTTESMTSSGFTSTVLDLSFIRFTCSMYNSSYTENIHLIHPGILSII